MRNRLVYLEWYSSGDVGGFLSSRPPFNALESLTVAAPEIRELHSSFSDSDDEYHGRLEGDTDQHRFRLRTSLFPRLRTLHCRHVRADGFTRDFTHKLVHASFDFAHTPLGVLRIPGGITSSKELHISFFNFRVLDSPSPRPDRHPPPILNRYEQSPLIGQTQKRSNTS